MVTYEETVERRRFHSFCKVVLRHEMLDCFREFSYQNKWLVSLNHLPPSALDGICTTDQWIEDLVVSETMKMVMDDKAIEAIVSMLMDLLDRENVNLPLYEQQLRETDTAIQNLLNAIQQGILTKSTKGRLEELEATKEELETRIACEKLAKPKVSAEFMTFWFHRFRKLDVRQKSHRKMLIDTFVNAIFLYDDKMVITFNYKDGTDTITFDDLKAALDKEKTGSDLDCSTAPKIPNATAFGIFTYYFFTIPSSFPRPVSGIFGK